MSENVWCLRLIWLKAKLIIRLPLSSSFSGSCSFLSYSFLYTTLLCPLILSHFLCSWSPFCRLQDLSCSWSGVYPLGVRLVKRLVPYPLEGGFVCCYCDQSLCWILRGTSPLLCGCHCPVCGGVCSLVGGTEPLDLFLWFWSVWRQVGLENTPWERSPWGLPLWGISRQGVFSASPSCLVRALMWPWLALRLAPPWPWAWWHTALVPLRCCFPRVTSIDPLDSGPRIASSWSWARWGAMGAAQTPAWSCPLVCLYKGDSCYSYTCRDWGSPGCPFRCSVRAEVTKPVVGIKAWLV